MTSPNGIHTEPSLIGEVIEASTTEFLARDDQGDYIAQIPLHLVIEAIKLPARS